MFSSKSDSYRQLRTFCDILLLQFIIFSADYDQDLGEFSKSKPIKNFQLDAIVCSHDNFKDYKKKCLKDISESDITYLRPCCVTCM
jgi:hypothetical protein